MYRAHHERSNIDVSFVKHLIFLEKIFPSFYTSPLGRKQQTKVKTLLSGHYTLRKCYSAPRKKQYHCFNHGAPKSSRKNTFTHALSVNKSKSK